MLAAMLLISTLLMVTVVHGLPGPRSVTKYALMVHTKTCLRLEFGSRASEAASLKSA